MKFLKICFILLFLVSLLEAQSIARWFTSMGDFEVTLREDLVPITVGNFVDLTNSNFYDDLIFHRVIADFMIQDGCPEGTGYGGPGYTIPDEYHPDINYNVPYVIGMANTGQPNSAGSQYFITVEPYPSLNNNYAAFGHVTMGSDIVEAISEVPTTGPSGNPPDKPLVDVEIDSIRIMTPQFYGFTPEEDSIYAAAGEELLFGTLSNEPDLTYSWFINDELQSETSFLLNTTLSLNGWNEVKAVVSNGEYDYIKIWWVEITGGTLVPENTIPDIYALNNYPNPFNPETIIYFETTDLPTNAQIEIYNVKGQKIRRFIDFQKGDKSRYFVIWDGTDDNKNPVSSGIYFYRLQVGESSLTKKALLLK